MSVKISNILVITQGWAGVPHGNHAVTNTGAKEVTNIQIKVIGAVVFSSLASWSGGYMNCLNQYTGAAMSFYEGGHNLLPGATKTTAFHIAIKSDAPIQVHEIECEFLYDVL